MDHSYHSHYDFIIAGAGCAGLSLAVHMIQSGSFTGKKVLLIDRDSKNKNDRTWCFWEKEAGLFEPIVSKQWQHLWFHGDQFSRLLNIGPYQYKLIRGIDFYNYCLDIIKRQSNFTILQEEIKAIRNIDGRPSLECKDRILTADYIFNSILFSKPTLGAKEYFLLQHFKGWIIETAKDSFDPNQATLMDFRVDQSKGTSFVYVMPFRSRKALVEYTLFTAELLRPEEYDEGLRAYLNEFMSLKEYRVSEEEFGVIPMTNHTFPRSDGNIIFIGTAGGQTKGSSGYTFKFIQKHAAFIVRQLIAGKTPLMPATKRYHFYDSVLLDILQNKKLTGQHIFTSLFKKNKPQPLLRFLDNESSLKEELSIISTLPTGPFLRSGLKHL